MPKVRCKPENGMLDCTLHGGAFVSENDGDAAAGPFETTFWWSQDQVLDASDLPMRTKAYPGLAPHSFRATGVGKLVFTVPAWTGGWVIAVVDGANAVVEIDETNNVFPVAPVVSLPSD